MADSFSLAKLKIYVNENDFFEARNINIFTNYVLTFYNASLISKWQAKCDMTFYQNQLNFAVWCASTGCGVSIKDHLNSKDKLTSSLFRFHVYYQTRKILEEMSCTIPEESIFNATDNRINMKKFEKICNEFDINTAKDFRIKVGDNGGLGTMYNYATRLGYRALKGATYNPDKFQFIENSTNDIIKIDYVWQKDATDGWKHFLLEKSERITRAGFIRLDDSIRAYVYCILGAQAQTRSSILNSPETQQTFVDLLEKNISSMFSIPESIKQYQDSISNTRSKIDFVIGIGLYMIPSNLVLNVGSVKGYNNNIIIASQGMKLGYNKDINEPIETAKPSIQPIIIQQTESKSTKEVESLNNVYLYAGVCALVFGLCFYFRKDIF